LGNHIKALSKLGILLRKEGKRMRKAERLLAEVKAEHGNYSYKCGFPNVFDDDDYTFIADGKLLKESAEDGGPFYVADFVEDDELFIVEEETIYKVKNIKDLEDYLKGKKENLEKEEREIIWC